MTKYIDTSKLIELVEQSIADNPHSDPKIANNHSAEHYHFLYLISKTPSEDVTPIRYGHIIETIENGTMKRITSCCGEDVTTMTMWSSFEYCPRCGAKTNSNNIREEYN